MDRRLLLASALGLLVPGVALAQGPGGGRPGGGGGSPPGGGSGPGGGGQRPPGGGPGGGGHPGGGGPGGGPGGGGPGSGGGRPPGGGNTRPPPGGGPGGGPRPPGGNTRPPGNPGGHRPPSGGHRPPPRPQPSPPLGPHRPGSGRPPGFRPIRGPTWRYPRGYRYRRWSIGLLLPAVFLSTAYYFDDYWRMGLDGPPWGYRWVRYGPDLLLVETATGRIEDVIYGAFY